MPFEAGTLMILLLASFFVEVGLGQGMHVGPAVRMSILRAKLVLLTICTVDPVQAKAKMAY